MVMEACLFVSRVVNPCSTTWNAIKDPRGADCGATFVSPNNAIQQNLCLRLSSFCCLVVNPFSLLRGKVACSHWIFTHVAKGFLVEWQILALLWGNDNGEQSKMCSPHNKNEKVNEKRTKTQLNPVQKAICCDAWWFICV